MFGFLKKKSGKGSPEVVYLGEKFEAFYDYFGLDFEYSDGDEAKPEICAAVCAKIVLEAVAEHLPDETFEGERDLVVLSFAAMLVANTITIMTKAEFSTTASGAAALVMLPNTQDQELMEKAVKLAAEEYNSWLNNPKSQELNFVIAESAREFLFKLDAESLQPVASLISAFRELGPQEFGA